LKGEELGEVSLRQVRTPDATFTVVQCVLTLYLSLVPTLLRGNAYKT